MSFDIVILNLDRQLASLEEFGDEDVAKPMGTHTHIQGLFTNAFQGVRWNGDQEGLYIDQEYFAFEISISDVGQSVHLALRFFDQWDGPGENKFNSAMRGLCEKHGWQAFAVSDNSKMDFADA